MNVKSFKFWFNIFTFIALALLVYFARDQITAAFSNLKSLNFYFLILIIPLQLFNYFATAKFYQNQLKNLGEKVSTKLLYRIALEMNFINNVFPSGGVSGFGYLGLRLRKQGIPGSKSTLLQITRHALTFLSFITYLIIALFMLAAFGQASRMTVFTITSVVFLIIIGAGALVYLISSEERIKRFTIFLPQILNKVISKFRRSKKRTINIARIEKLFVDLHSDYKTISKDFRILKKPFIWTLLMNASELATIYVVYLAFSEIVNPGAIIVAYAVANMAGLLSVLPGGVGVYEGLMTAVMASAGVNKGLALSATVTYRILNMSIFLPIGYVLYTLAQRESMEDPEIDGTDHIHAD